MASRSPWSSPPRFRSLAPETIVERLGPHSRLLDAGRTRLDVRHRTLRDTIGWSYELLADERTLFDQLSVFAGSFDLPAVEAVCDPAAEQGVERATASSTSWSRWSTSRRCRWSTAALSAAGDAAGVRAGALEDGGGVDAVAAVTCAGSRSWPNGAGVGWPAARGGRVVARGSRPTSTTSVPPMPGRCGPATSMPPSRLVAGLREYAFRRIRYELDELGRDALELPGAADHPLYPIVVATVGLRPLRPRRSRSRPSRSATGPRGPEPGLRQQRPGRTHPRQRLVLPRAGPTRRWRWMDRMVASALPPGRPRGSPTPSTCAPSPRPAWADRRGAVLAGEAQARPAPAPPPPRSAQANDALGLALESTEPPESLRLLRQAALIAARPATDGSKRLPRPKSAARGLPRDIPASAHRLRLRHRHLAMRRLLGQPVALPPPRLRHRSNRSAIDRRRRRPARRTHCRLRHPTPCPSNLATPNTSPTSSNSSGHRSVPRHSNRPQPMAPPSPNPNSSPTSNNALPTWMSDDPRLETRRPSG